MGRLSIDDIQAEVEKKGYKLIDAAGYANMQSIIKVQCPHSHICSTSLAIFRAASFSCPECDKNIKFHNPTSVPKKSGYRVIAFDQATEHFGLSVFDAGELVFFNLYTFTGNVTSRLVQIRKFVRDIVIKE